MNTIVTVPLGNVIPVLPNFSEFYLVYSAPVDTLFKKQFTGVSSDITSILRQYIFQFCEATSNPEYKNLRIDELNTKLYQAVHHYVEFLFKEATLTDKERSDLIDFLKRLSIQSYKSMYSTVLTVLMDVTPTELDANKSTLDMLDTITITTLHNVH